MNKLSPDQAKQYETLKRIKEDIESELLSRPGVRGVGVGFKNVKGKPTKQLAIRVYVTEKRDVADKESIPATIGGVPTDVIEFNARRMSDKPPPRRPTTNEAVMLSDPDKAKYDPLVGGISLGLSREVAGYMAPTGTMGLMVKDGYTDAPLMLSNYHVMCANDGKAKIGDLLCQPSREDQWLDYCSDCAQLLRWVLEGDVKDSGISYGGVDSAVASLTHRTASVGKIVEIGQITGTAAATLKMQVLKRGRTTKLTEGVVDDIDLTWSDDFGPPYGRVELKKQIMITPTTGKFMEDGDSGSVLVAKVGKQVVGLLWAGDDTSGRALANPIAAVIKALDIKIV
ncbi:MAG: hypothetical protein WAV20_02200 [Blastocatellia bacterium]